MANTKQRNLEELCYGALKEINYAERKILKSLRQMAQAATDESLKNALEKHREQTQVHVERLLQCLQILGKHAQGKTCDAFKEIISEGEEILDEFSESRATAH